MRCEQGFRQHKIVIWPTIVARQRSRRRCVHTSWWRHSDGHLGRGIRSVTGDHVGRKWRHKDDDGARPRAGDEATSAERIQRPWRARHEQPTSTTCGRALDAVPRDVAAASGIRPAANVARRRRASPAAQRHLYFRVDRNTLLTDDGKAEVVVKSVK